MKYTKGLYLKAIRSVLGVTALSAIILLGSCGSKEYEVKDVNLETSRDSLSYAIGLLIGEQYKDQQHWDGVNLLALKKGLMESVKDEADLEMSFRELANVVQKFDRSMALGYSNKILDENKSKEGVNVTPSGMQYKVVSEGEGPIPQMGDSVEIHYEIGVYGEQPRWSSFQNGAPQKMMYSNQMMMPGIDEAVGLMKSGSVWELLLPADLALGADGNPQERIPPHAVWEVKISLIEVYKN